jgi:hypothetical protein
LPYLDMARAPSRFSLKIQKRVFVKALMGDGIRTATTISYGKL